MTLPSNNSLIVIYAGHFVAIIYIIIYLNSNWTL